MRSGILLLDKPAGITSHDLVARTRKALGTKKVGHAGTLDPMATGLMILGVNQGTKLMQYFSGLDKSYSATVVLGQSTTTDDYEGEVTAETDAIGVSAEEIEREMSKLRGEIMQVPASVSAIKIGGKRAHELVRSGQEFELSARKVTVSRFERASDLRQKTKTLEFDVEVDCSSGTYVRSLARDLGSALGVGGHLGALRRTRIGDFLVSQASQQPDSAEVIELATAAASLLPSLTLSAAEAEDVGHGKRISISITEPTAAIHDGRLVAILDCGGKILTGFPKDHDA